MTTIKFLCQFLSVDHTDFITYSLIHVSTVKIETRILSETVGFEFKWTNESFLIKTSLRPYLPLWGVVGVYISPNNHSSYNLIKFNNQIYIIVKKKVALINKNNIKAKIGWAIL